MIKWIVSGLLFLICISSYSQNLDLVVTTSGDSIACKIDSITESSIYLQIKTAGNDNWVQTIYDTNNIKQHQYNCIEPSKYDYKNSTSRINVLSKPAFPKKFPGKSSLEKASPDELYFYLAKAKKTKEAGAKMSIIGPVAAITGLFMSTNSITLGEDDANFDFGSLLFVAGIGTTLVGIPILITGSSRVKNINKIKKSRIMTMEFAPAGNYNFQANSYQPGLTLRIRF